ncbi:hypothetical protein [Heyndrickxia oleronia]|uniref:hypothetical protein n=1 Tax=Heyndrickxia oleronia TaxID=38875 RepID=UPI001474CC27|nr:hypothetical protein [Heyndrickxia oleronia]
MWWLYVLLGILIVLPIVFFSNGSNTKKRMDKDLEKNPYDQRNNLPPPGAGPF